MRDQSSWIIINQNGIKVEIVLSFFFMKVYDVLCQLTTLLLGHIVHVKLFINISQA